MKNRSTLILMVLMAVILAGLAIKVFTESDETPPPTGYVLQNLISAGYKPEDITTVEIEKNGAKPEKLIFERDGKTRWKMVSPVATRVQYMMVEQIVRQLLKARGEKGKADPKDPSSGITIRDKKAHGLESPGVKVTLKKGDERQATLAIGNVSTGDPMRSVAYVIPLDGKTENPSAVKRNALSSLFKSDEADAITTADMLKSAEEFRQTKLLGDVADAVNQTNRFSIKRGKDELTVVRGDKGVWLFDKPGDFGEVETGDSAAPPPKLPGGDEINNLRKLLNSAYDIQVASNTDFIDTPEDPVKYGLKDNPDEIQIRIDRRALADEAAAGTEVIYIGKPVEGADKYYARLGGEQSVAKINAAPVKALLLAMQNPKALRNKDLTKFNVTKADAVDVQIGTSTFELRETVPGLWQGFDPAGNPFRASASSVNQLLEALTKQGLVMDFPPPGFPEDQLGVDAKNKVAEIRIWLGGVLPDKKEEPKKGDPKKDEVKKDEPKKEEAKKEEAKKEEPKPVTKPKLFGDPSVRIIFGKDSGQGIYARRIEGGKIDVLLPKAFFEVMIKRPYLDYIDPGIRPLNGAEMVKLQFNRGKDLYEVVKDGNDWRIVLPEANKGRLADTAKVSTIIEQISRMRPNRVIADNPKPDDFKKWKVGDADAVIKATLTDKAGKANVVYFGDDTPDKLNVYLRVPGEKFVFELSKVWIGAMTTGDLVDPVVYRVDKTKVKGMKITGWSDIVGAPTPREFEFKNGIWTFKTNPGYELDAGKIAVFVEEVLSPRAESFVAKMPAAEHGLDLAKGALQIEFLMEGDKNITLLIGAAEKDGKLVFAQSNQMPGEVFTLLKDRFKSVREKPAVFKKD